ncbi:uncharacterized mitochondrial protein AtMg00810-like [Solanum verrucosum]|uniref:uncharacterized mitochondrial protein AtMg00810-like n=1 Tax=Solanum verrucosum TaxID=315347 RepID=UPI0020D19AAC|nr:uncharacterized mitochondrial protein AtMg00810-like [Solanum verrucosum]
MGSSHSTVAEFKSSMMSKFEMTDLDLLHYFLGLEVKQGEGEVFVSQKKYASDLLKRFGLVNCKSAATPMNMNEKLHQEDGTGQANARSFRSLVGDLIYLAHTCPDISILLVLFQGSVDDRKSTSGNVFSLGSGAITWSSKKQVTTTLSSSEAEYIATTTSACQCIWLRRILVDLN